MANYKNIKVSKNSPIITITLNRPQVKNAMSLALLDELLLALKDAEKETDTRLIVIRGADGNFSAGADIKDLAKARNLENGSRKAIKDISIAFGHMTTRFASTPLTIICGLEGAVMGGGFGLACACDIAIATHTVKFALPETRLGLIPAQIAPVLLERIGYSHAKRLAVTGGTMDAEEALQIGLVHAVTQNLDATLEKAVDQALQCAPDAVAQTKVLLRKIHTKHNDKMIKDAAKLFADAVLGEEGQEGTKAFKEKRKPNWAQKSRDNS